MASANANPGDDYAPWSSVYSNLCKLNAEVAKYSSNFPSEIKDSKDLPRALNGALDIITDYLVRLEYLSNRLFNQNDAECNEDEDFAPGKEKIRATLNTLVGCLHLIIVTFTTRQGSISAPSKHDSDMMIGIFSKTQELYLEEDARTKRSDKDKYFKLWEELFHGDKAVAMQELIERLAESKISADELPDAKLPESARPNVKIDESKVGGDRLDADAQSEWESLMSRAVVAAENQTQDQKRYDIALTQLQSAVDATNLSDFDSRRDALYKTLNEALRAVPVPLIKILNNYRTQLKGYLDFQVEQRRRMELSRSSAAISVAASDVKIAASGSLSKQVGIVAPPVEHKVLAASVQVQPAAALASIAAKPKKAPSLLPPPIPPRRKIVFQEAKAQIMSKFRVHAICVPIGGGARAEAGTAGAVVSSSHASHAAFFSSSSSLNGGGGGAAPAVVANTAASLLVSASGSAASQQHQQQPPLPRPGVGMSESKS